MVKKTFSIGGMHCASCSLMIEADLEDIGVTASCSYAKGTLDVEYDEQKVTEQSIKEIVQKAGYAIQSNA